MLLKTLVIPILLILLRQSTCTYILNVTSTNNIASGTTNHVYTLYGFGEEIFPGMYIQITYDSVWNLGSASGYDTGDFCEIADCSISTVTYSQTGNIVTINGLFPQYIDTNTIYTFRYTIKNIHNPTTMYTQNIEMNFYMSDGSLFNWATTSISVSPTLMTCTGTPDNLLISNFATYSFSITPSTTLPSNGYILAKFPSQWGDSAQPNTFQSPTCSNGIGTVTCTQQGISTIKLNNLIPTNTSSSFSFNISGIRNPATSGVNQELSLGYYNVGGLVVSYCVVSIKGLKAKALVGVSFNIACDTNVETSSALMLTVTQPPLSTDKMTVTFPGDIIVSYLTKVFIYAGNDTIPLSTQISLQSVSSTQSRISFFPFKTSILNYFRIELYNLKCPSTIHQTNNISIDIYRMGYSVMTYQCCNITSTLTLFQSATIFIADNRMAQLTNYDFNITINRTLGAGTHYIDFIFPSQYSLTLGSTFPCLIQGYSTPATTHCTIISTNTLSLSLTTSNLSLILSTLINSNTLTPLQLQITILNITNPSLSQVSFDIYLSDSSHYYLQGITGIKGMLVPALISNVRISLDSYQVNAVAKYTFNVNNTNTLLATGVTLRIIFPPQLTLLSPSCQINTIPTSFTQFTNSTHQLLDITLPSISITQYGLYTYSIQVYNVLNPQSFELTDSFEFQLYQSGVLLEGVYEGLAIAMNVSAGFQSLNIVVSNQTVSALSEYDLSYSLPFAINSSRIYKLKVLFPIDFSFLTCNSCTSYSQFTITTTSNILIFHSIKNPRETSISNPISIRLTINEYLSLEENYQIYSFTPIVQSFGVAFSSYLLGEVVTCRLMVYDVQSNVGKVVINVPTDITINSGLNITCLQCQLSSFTQSGHSLTVFITNITSSNITLQLAPLTTPLTSPSSSFTLSTYTSSSILISQSNTIVNYFNIICAVECATCNSSNVSQCFSCYQNSLVTNKKYFDDVGRTCVAACSASQFLSGLTCYACDSTCASCGNESHSCTACSGMLLLFNNQCLTNCPQYFYPLNGICHPCQPPCLTCTDQLTCTNCISGKLLNTNGSCQSTCPNGQYNLSNICVVCPLNCTLCTINGCNNCVSGNYLIDGICVSTCPYGYFVDSTSNICQICHFPCKYCSVSSSNCTGCDNSSSNPYLQNNQCLTSCLPTYYADEFNVCKQCQSPCINCHSLINCTSCQVGYIYYAATNQCLLSCFPNTIQVGSQCQACQSPCLQCSQTITNCTSCISNYFLDSITHTCNSTCNPPYMALNRTCTTCVSPCSVCTSGQPYSCISCINGYYLMQNNCYSTCPQTTYADRSGYCLPCTSGCYQCVNTSAICTACYPGTYLFGTVCMPNCPTTPTYYYEYQSQCITCQSPCKTCLATPIQCADCLSSTDYWNPVTLQCTATCVSPYFPVIELDVKQCKQCQLPCKSCSSNYDICSQCYSNKFLYNRECIDTCPQGYYGSDNNTCLQCPNLCATCTINKCVACLSGNFLYKSTCYNLCPSQAPYVFGSYCRNCIKDNCLLCDQQNQCVICVESYLIFNGGCLSECPTGYQPDTISNLSCIKTSAEALLQYYTQKQKLKTLIFPGTILLVFIVLSTIIFEGNKHISLYSLSSIPQTFTTIIFCYFYFIYAKSDLYIGFTFPPALLIAIPILGCVISVCFVVKWNKILMLDEEFRKCFDYGSTQKRANMIVIFSLINFKLIKMLFSGIMKVPFTCFQLRNKQLLSYLNWVNGLWIALHHLPMVFIIFYVIIGQRVYLSNNKIFFSALDCLVCTIVSLITTILYLTFKHQLPQPYKKHIISGVSDFTNQPLSQPNDYIGNQELDVMHLYHSNSVEDIQQPSKQMKQVDFKSVYDPSDFEQPPKMPIKQLQSAINKGKFRMKQKPKKKGKGKYKLDKLQIIDEQLNEQDDNRIKKKFRFRNKAKRQSLYNNYIYWQPPKTSTTHAQQHFRSNRKEIMQKIQQKESQFETITNNDIIFRDRSENDVEEEDIKDMKFSVEDVSEEILDNNQQYYQESKRQLQPIRNKTQYDDMLNLNYAKRKHLQ